MNIPWSGELMFAIVVFGVISLAGVLLFDQYNQDKKKEKKS